MILEESLKSLNVVIKGGGSLISHRPVFSSDSEHVFIIVSSTVYVYSTASGLCSGKFQTPSASTIVNIKALTDPPNSLLLLTSIGEFVEIDLTTYKIKSLRKIDLNIKNWIPISHFTDFIWPRSTLSGVEKFYILGYPLETIKPVLYSATTDHFFLETLCRNVEPHKHSVAVGQNGRFVVAIQENSLFVKDAESHVKWHKAGSRKFTCVAVHPHDWVCATGDDSGRVVLWTNALELVSPAKTIYHWHTLPVIDLSFSVDGSLLLSGGGECTLVKWDVKNTNNKRTLPRMGLPIRHIGVSPCNTYTAVSHADNCIQLVNSHKDIVVTIQNITQCYVPENSEDINASETSLGGTLVYRTGLHIDPNKQSLVMNGKPGNLQCYSYKEDKHLYSLDIAQQNYITAERNKVIPNVDVCQMSFSKNGVWLCTGESRVDDAKCTELRLKFWKFDVIKQKFILNTSIEWPHEEALVCLKVQPISEDDPYLIAATSGNDKKFKIWGVVHDPSIHGKSEWWNCENVGSYRELPAGPLSFSSDGSLLGAAFGRFLTMWESANHQLKLVLSHTKLQQSLRIVEFGTNSNSHLAICATADNLIVWDIVSASLMWVAPFQADSLTVDPFSHLVAAFSSKHHLFFFRLDKSEPIVIRKNISSCRVISSIFTSNPSQFEINGLKSTLIFINSAQELCALLSAEEEQELVADLQNKLKNENSSAVFPSTLLTAETIVKENSNRKSKKNTFVSGLPGYPILRQIMDASPHTMPSVTYFGQQLLQVLSIRRNPSDNLKDIETNVVNSHQNFKGSLNKSKGDLIDTTPSKSIIQEDIKSTDDTNTAEMFSNSGLDLVANDDIKWIEQIYSKN